MIGAYAKDHWYQIHGIVTDEINKNDKSDFLRTMVSETGKTLEEMSNLMKHLLEGLLARN